MGIQQKLQKIAQQSWDSFLYKEGEIKEIKKQCFEIDPIGTGHLIEKMREYYIHGFASGYLYGMSKEYQSTPPSLSPKESHILFVQTFERFIDIMGFDEWFDLTTDGDLDDIFHVALEAGKRGDRYAIYKENNQWKIKV